MGGFRRAFASGSPSGGNRFRFDGVPSGARLLTDSVREKRFDGPCRGCGPRGRRSGSVSGAAVVFGSEAQCTLPGGGPRFRKNDSDPQIRVIEPWGEGPMPGKAGKGAGSVPGGTDGGWCRAKKLGVSYRGSTIAGVCPTPTGERESPMGFSTGARCWAATECDNLERIP